MNPIFIKSNEKRDIVAELKEQFGIEELGYLLSGIDWRAPQYTWRPQAAG